MFPYGSLVAGIQYAVAEALEAARKRDEAISAAKQDNNVIDVESRWVDDPPEPPKLHVNPKTLHSR